MGTLKEGQQHIKMQRDALQAACTASGARLSSEQIRHIVYHLAKAGFEIDRKQS